MYREETPLALLYRKSAYLLGIALATLVVMAIALITGFFAAVYPTWFVLKVGIVATALVVWLFALLVTSDTAAPERLLKGMLNILLLLWGVWPAYLSYKVGSLPDINPVRLVYWTLIAVWLYSMTASKSFRSALFERVKSFKIFFWVITAFTLWQIVSGFASEYWSYSAYFAIKALLPGYVVFLIAVSVYRSLAELERAVIVVVIAAVIASLIGFAEAVHGSNLFLRFFPSDPEQLQSLAWILVEKSREGVLRVSSTFAHPLALAEYLSMCLPLAAYLMLKGATRTRRWLGLLAIPVIAAAIYLTHARSALIAVGAVTIIYATVAGLSGMQQGRRFAHSLLGAFVLVVVVVSGIAAIGSAMELAQGRTVAERGSTQARVIMYQRGMAAIEKQPVLGYGPGVAAYTIGRLPGQSTLTIDSYFLTVVLESGVLGLILYAWLLLYPIYHGAHLAIVERNHFGWLGLSLALALLAFLIEKTVLSLTNNFDFSWVLAGMLLTVVWLRNQAEGAEPGSGKRQVLNASPRSL